MRWPAVEERLIPNNIAHLLWKTAAAHASQPAVIECAGGAVTDYGALQQRAAGIAAALTAAGIKPHDRVGIFLDGGTDGVAAFFAVATAGGIAVTINESLRPRQIEHILERS